MAIEPLESLSLDLAMHPFIAYAIYSSASMSLVPASPSRPWMDQTDQQFANRCLPLQIANQAGWFVLNSQRLCVSWNGGVKQSDLIVTYPAGATITPAVSHFGHGILTWRLPYLFRTPAGYNLLVRGPANSPKDGVYPLEGVVEADWSLSTFTMNWQMTRTNHPVIFETGEPICMLVPQRRGELEEFMPEIQLLESDPEISQGFHAWQQSRKQFLTDLNEPDSEATKRRWQKDYFEGVTPDGDKAPEHQRRLELKKFINLQDKGQTSGL